MSHALHRLIGETTLRKVYHYPHSQGKLRLITCPGTQSRQLVEPGFELSSSFLPSRAQAHCALLPRGVKWDKLGEV